MRSIKRTLLTGVAIGSLVKSAHASLTAPEAGAITCDEFKSEQNSYTNPTRSLYRSNCVDWDAPMGLPNVTGEAFTSKSPAPQVIGAKAVAKELCGGLWRTMYDTGMVVSYNVQTKRVSGVGTYAQCMNHDTRFLTRHNYYQSDPPLNQSNRLCIPATCPPE